LILPRQLVLPDSQHPPARAAQRPVHQFIPAFIAGKFLPLEGAVVLRLRRVPGAAVPETTVHEKCEPHLPENEIWFHL